MEDIVLQIITNPNMGSQAKQLLEKEGFIVMYPIENGFSAVAKSDIIKKTFSIDIKETSKIQDGKQVIYYESSSDLKIPESMSSSIKQVNFPSPPS